MNGRINNAASSVIQHGAFMPGVPDVDLFPFSVWRRLVAKYIAPSQSNLLHYTHLGYGPLKVALANYLRVTRMMVVDPKQIIAVVSGPLVFKAAAGDTLEITGRTERQGELVLNMTDKDKNAAEVLYKTIEGFAQMFAATMF